MIGYIAAALIAAQSAPVGPGDAATVYARVGRSEWCPSGAVRVDLISGRFALTPRASRRVCQDRGLERPLIQGTLSADALARLRAAHARAVAEGLESEACRRGEVVDVIISNGGPRTLLVGDGAGGRSAPAEFACWSQAATDLETLLDETFRQHHGR